MRRTDTYSILVASAAVFAALALPGLLRSPSLHSAYAAPSEKSKTETSKGKEAPKAKQAPKQLPARPAFTAEEDAVAKIPSIPDARVWGDSSSDFITVLPSASGPWLAMSGGGADGAFAAGVLVGWSQAGTRPEFSLVTGASIGALISPFAFLGTRYDAELRETITTISAADIFEDRPTAESFLDSWPLKALIAKHVTAKLLADVAAEHRRGRRLLTVTTNIDTGRRVLWNMGAISERGDDKALKLFRDVLLASASIPGFFPPVFFEVEANGHTFQEMHLDGSITSPFFVVPEEFLASEISKPLPATELYIISNSRLKPEFSAPERNTVAILGRLIGVVLKAGLRAELLLVASNAQRLGVTSKVAQVAESFQHPARGLFDPAYMRALFDHGIERATKGTAFEPVSTASVEHRNQVQ